MKATPVGDIQHNSANGSWVAESRSIIYIYLHWSCWAEVKGMSDQQQHTRYPVLYGGMHNDNLKIDKLVLYISLTE